MRHIPVLLHEVLDGLNLRDGIHVIDGTLGDAGHSEKILEQISPNGRLLGIDADAEAILRAKKFLENVEDRTTLVRGNFAEIDSIVAQNNFEPVHAILIDLGWSSPQFEERGRGFSFQLDEPLDMRYDSTNGNDTAATLVQELDRDQLATIFKEYGEEKLSEQIAEAIVEKRKEQSIETTKQLTDIILQVYREKLKTDKEIPWIGGIHPATKVFQALRIAVNRELDVLKEVLPKAIDVLASGGRLAIISFHSLEDRIVKHYFKSQQGKTVNIITKKPIVCTDDEAKENPRARSAKLRIVEKI